MAIEVGNILEGKVSGIKPFGAFVSLPEGRSGLVHISEVSNEFVREIGSVLSEGQEVKVQVINIAPDGKIALSIKRLQPRPEHSASRPGAPRGDRPAGGQRSFGGGRDARGGNGGPRRPRSETPRVWQPKAVAPADNLSFEDMMSRFKSQSEEKMADLDHETTGRRGGHPPRGHKGGPVGR